MHGTCWCFLFLFLCPTSLPAGFVAGSSGSTCWAADRSRSYMSVRIISWTGKTFKRLFSSTKSFHWREPVFNVKKPSKKSIPKVKVKKIKVGSGQLEFLFSIFVTFVDFLALKNLFGWLIFVFRVVFGFWHFFDSLSMFFDFFDFLLTFSSCGLCFDWFLPFLTFCWFFFAFFELWSMKYLFGCFSPRASAKGSS